MTVSPNNDTELYELCKQVYEKTGWSLEGDWEADEKHPHWQGNEWYDHAYVALDPNYNRYEWEDGTVHETGTAPQIVPNLAIKGGFASRLSWVTYYPLYTSDYLLEKLPKESEELGYLDLCSDGGNWMARYTRLSATSVYNKAATPLKALLKLTLALHEAGVLHD